MGLFSIIVTVIDHNESVQQKRFRLGKQLEAQSAEPMSLTFHSALKKLNT